MTEFQPIEAQRVLQRYNVALAQAMLYRCRQLQVTVGRTSVRIRQLFGAVKLNCLIHVLTRHEVGFHLDLDGPVSMLRHSQRYGVRMAAFLPALLHCDFELQADIPDIDSGSTRDSRRFVIDQKMGLVSHHRAATVYDSELEATFARRFDKLNSPWRLERETEVVDLQEVVMIPDFAFRHDDGRVRLLEIVGYWRPEYLARKLTRLREARRSLGSHLRAPQCQSRRGHRLAGRGDLVQRASGSEGRAGETRRH
jgi:hypothetical protein